MYIKTEEEYHSLKNKTTFTFRGKECGKEITTKKLSAKKQQEKQARLLCKNCKAVQTMKELYGVKYPLQSKEILEKAILTCLQKYGVENYTQTLEYHKRKNSKHEYDNLTFDSSWELKFYKYYKSKGANIIYHPCCLEYEFNGKEA